MNKYKITFISFSAKNDYKHSINFESNLDIDELGEEDQPLRDEIYASLSPDYKVAMIYDIEKLTWLLTFN